MMILPLGSLSNCVIVSFQNVTICSLFNKKLKLSDTFMRELHFQIKSFKYFEILLFKMHFVLNGKTLNNKFDVFELMVYWYHNDANDGNDEYL